MTTNDNTLVIYSDGGSLGNGSAGALAYGSLLIRPFGPFRGQRIQKSFGHGTNNQAEYKALINAVRAVRVLLSGLARAGHKLPAAAEFRLDSKLVVDQLEGRARCKAANLRPLYERAQRDLTELAKEVEVCLVRISGDEMKNILGH